MHFNLTKAILAEQFGKKLKTETASFDAYYFRNLSNISSFRARIQYNAILKEYNTIPIPIPLAT